MSNDRTPLTGRDVAGAGALLMSVNAIFAGIGAGIGALLDATVPLMVAGFLVGFIVGIAVVIDRFRNV